MLIMCADFGKINFKILPPSSGRAGKILISNRIKFISSFKIKNRIRFTRGPHINTINSFVFERLFLYFNPIP